MRLLVNLGHVPTALFGPGDVRDCHTPDESVAVDEGLLAARTLILSAKRSCGVVAPTDRCVEEAGRS
jgi:acetylornithine deacetylase